MFLRKRKHRMILAALNFFEPNSCSFKTSQPANYTLCWKIVRLNPFKSRRPLWLTKVGAVNGKSHYLSSPNCLSIDTIGRFRLLKATLTY